ncbi:CRISPR-associated endoribonuclease Cas2 [Shouchella clausii]|uniref:CRISPR-associated endonuclease Cas2 n=1 Tax=Shouchella TaxID=2893057 RepID=UPI001AFFA02F|nr:MULTISPECIES: CRISPR-associated endonuclease Cas2 [Shouchella]MCM3378862.1 CRISPR-associated endonuclease Cas2 [Shouchella rhizosphaerae]MDO7269577.1 CRISPR-associated endonuclease Cas2 [Shouchella clausii]MDO7289519.1 CRISPR-associated endonuclease Cas2 [Shouchella clausii]GIN18523.1 CRISPR-associated endoribonuclease Cas2 [Shouchella clausii]
MLVLVTYDVAITTNGGAARLRRVAKICEQYGVRVQNSVFECIVDATQKKRLEMDLIKVIDQQSDSIRIYQLGNQYRNKVNHIGAKETLNVEDPLIF